jgi:glycosyltransferase involved in cell wall biosynthesis
LNESHHLLFPETATCDKKILEEKFEEYLKDVDKRFQVIEYAWEKLNEHYSFKVIKKQLTDLYEAVK